MTTILDKIITEKQKEIIKLKNKPLKLTDHPYTGPTFTETVRGNNKMAMIAEIKRASPSKGLINEGVNPAQQAKIYEANGASAISVLTDTPFFQGTMDDLRAVRAAVNIPILCKDFIIDPIQIDHAKAAGANIILLIAAALDDDTMKQLYEYALAKNLEVICEVHHETEMDRIKQLNPALIGVNNRDLKTFHVDLSTTERVAKTAANPEAILIGESGIKHRSDVETLADAGAEAILIGETLMRADDVSKKAQEMLIPLNKKASQRL